MGRWLFATAGTLALAVLLVGALVGSPPSPAPASPPVATVTPAAATVTASPTAAARETPQTPTPTPRAVATASPIPAPRTAFDSAGNDFPSGLRMTTSWSVGEVAPGMLRFLIEIGGTSRYYPKFTVVAYDRSALQGSGGELEITIPNGEDVTTTAQSVGRDPLRAIAVGSPSTFRAKVYRLGLDSLRPWRVVVLWDPMRIAIDVGGPAAGLSDDGETAVYTPTPASSVATAFRVSGAVRAFEATFAWRVKDASGSVIAGGTGMANIGTSPVWGAYELDVTLPPGTRGPISLEVFQRSPRDGSEFGTVRVPLTAR